MIANKLIYSILSAGVCISLAGCAQSETETRKEKDSGTKSEQTHASEWSYSGSTGPEHWGDLDAANAACANGKEQSPINLENSKVKADARTENVEIHYKSTAFSLANNGHTIQGNPAAAGNSIILGGKEYKLAQFHFHLPSEHQMNGKNLDMELHLVHKDSDNQLAVLGLMIKNGDSNQALNKAWEVLPKEKTTEDVKLSEPIDLVSLLPKEQTTIQYRGSLTTPPCTEGVKWLVMEQPIQMSKDQIATFRELFPDNHRPVEPLNDREIVEAGAR
ncbi:carbonic anhydrase [Peribacillus sp. SCS-155]|uniref:carbonic anhydrase n=1 Tax=Peribacillus sedimenti TaxID=3115297 RepID=UPI003906D4E5